MEDRTYIPSCLDPLLSLHIERDQVVRQSIFSSFTVVSLVCIESNSRAYRRGGGGGLVKYTRKLR